jgi:TPR repeat protein
MWKAITAGAVLICVAAAGGGYVYRQHQISDGIAAYHKGDYQTAYSTLRPYSGWWDSTAQAAIADIDLNGKATGFFGGANDNVSALPENYKEALAMATSSANAGNPFGQYVLSMMYMNGWAVSENDKEAFNLSQQSAQQGFGLAAMELGTLYQFGQGVTQDDGQAVKYFKQALDAGIWQADDMLGFAYNLGSGVPQDAVKAASYYQDAANHGDDTAQYNLGDDYLTGNGVTADFDKAQPLLLAAAVQGNSGAMSDLGTVYSAGGSTVGYTPQDFARAYMFFDLAVANGDKGSAGDDKTDLAKHMTPDQIASGQAMASSWVTGKPFPESSYEDIAAQRLFAVNGMDTSTIPDTKVWFSWSFSSSGLQKYAVFLKSVGTDANGNTCHACGAKISVVTFAHGPTPATSNSFTQPLFTVSGSYGDTSPILDAKAAFSSPSRAGAIAFDLGNGQLALLLPSGDEGQGETDLAYQAFVFNPKDNDGAGSWHTAGYIKSGSDNGGECDPTGKSTDGEQNCYKWSGTVALLPQSGGAWPKLIVHAKGTAFDSTFTNIIQAPDLTFSYDGQKFTQTTPPPPS